MVNLVYHSVARGRFEVLGVTWRWVYRDKFGAVAKFYPLYATAEAALRYLTLRGPQ
jgi:hypothetical protein